MSETLERIWHQFAEKLGQFIRWRVSDPATAQDILRDLFVKIQKRLLRFGGVIPDSKPFPLPQNTRWHPCKSRCYQRKRK